MTRTSLTHPLRIQSVSAGPDCGRIGITFCPGKKDHKAMTGAWDRDLAIDLDAVARWNAAAVVTLIEDHELQSLGVPDLGAEVALRHMDWIHLPIADYSVPGSAFEQAWQSAGRDLHSRLRTGADILVHCKGGLGRAGMIAARLLVELGCDPDRAIREVRKARSQDAIETAAQEQHVLGCKAVEAPRPSEGQAAIADRAVGSLLGLAVGDAVGTALEFTKKPQLAALSDMVGGGPFKLQAGQWTDDTAMALALADSLLANPDLDPADLMARFVDWWRSGTYSCTGTCFDIGNTVRGALSRFMQNGDPLAGSTDPDSAGNGALMRLAPVAIRHWNNRQRLGTTAALQTRTTHGAAEAVSASDLFAGMLADAIAGKPRHEVLGPRAGTFAGRINEIATSTSWRGQHRNDICGSGYVCDSLNAALWSVSRTGDFRSAILLAANLGEDADTTAAVAGQLAGALYGLSGIPDDWLTRVVMREKIKQMAEGLFERSTIGCPAS